MDSMLAGIDDQLADHRRWNGEAREAEAAAEARLLASARALL